MFVWFCRGPGRGSRAHRAEDNVHEWRNFTHYQHQVPRCSSTYNILLGMLNQVVFNVLKNPNPLKDDEASALLDAAVLV